MFHKFKEGHLYYNLAYGFNTALILSRTETEMDVLLFRNNTGSEYIYGRVPLETIKSCTSEDTCEKFNYTITRDDTRPYVLDINRYKPLRAGICAWSECKKSAMEVDHQQVNPRDVAEDALKTFEERARYYTESARMLSDVIDSMKDTYDGD